MDKRMVYRVLSVLFALLFFFMVLLQFNDPDALKWVFFYGLGLIAALLCLLERIRISWVFSLSCFYMLLSIYFWPDKFEGFSVEKGNID
ncbi:MAG: transmembrane 220 family protein, partial [Bacteroidota bacterium]